MAITSSNFLLFTLITWLVYHNLPTQYKKYGLLTASLWFYGTWSWNFVWVGLGLVTINYFLGLKLRNKSRVVLWVGVGLNLLALVHFKYAGFYIDELRGLLNSLGVSTGANSIKIILPLGLSYYVLQGISYLLDIWHGRIEPQKDFVLLSLYMLYFPKLIAGPIESPRQFFPRLGKPNIVTNPILAKGFGLILVGLIRKLVFADPLTALLPEDAFTAPANYPSQFLLWWLVIFAFALYNDFSGYTNIVRGVSLLFGIELTQNFRRPYFSENFTEFWQRWHISLSIWLRDYIFYPITRTLMKLTNKRNHIINIIFPPMVTMLISGLWHGASWNMLVWGGLHGLYQVGERLWNGWRPKQPENPSPWRRRLAVGLVFGLTVITWTPFIMSLEMTGAYLKELFSLSNWVIPDIPRVIKYIVLNFEIPEWNTWLIPDIRFLIPLLPGLLLDWLQEKHQDETFFLAWGKWQQASLLAGAMLAILLATGASEFAPFVYQAF